MPRIVFFLSIFFVLGLVGVMSMSREDLEVVIKMLDNNNGALCA